MLCSDADLADSGVRQESAQDYFGNVDCSAYGFASGFDVDFLRSAVKEGYACQHVVHHWFISDQH
jgi:hypothetical protein